VLAGRQLDIIDPVHGTSSAVSLTTFFPRAIALNPTGPMLYICDTDVLTSARQPDGLICPVDLTSRTALPCISGLGFGEDCAIPLAPDGNRAYGAASGSLGEPGLFPPTLSVFDTTTGMISQGPLNLGF